MYLANHTYIWPPRIVHDLRVCHWQVTDHRAYDKTRVSGYPGLDAVKPVNPGLKNNPRVCIPYMAVICESCGFRFIYIFMRLLRWRSSTSIISSASEATALWRYRSFIIIIIIIIIHPPPIKMEKFATRRYAIFSPYKLPKVNYSLLLPTHYTEHHPVISHRDVPPQECCTSGTPSAMPKDRFPASTFDSHLQSASFGDHIAN